MLKQKSLPRSIEIQRDPPNKSCNMIDKTWSRKNVAMRRRRLAFDHGVKCGRVKKKFSSSAFDLVSFFSFAVGGMASYRMILPRAGKVVPRSTPLGGVRCKNHGFPTTNTTTHIDYDTYHSRFVIRHSAEQAFRKLLHTEIKSQMGAKAMHSSGQYDPPTTSTISINPWLVLKLLIGTC